MNIKKINIEIKLLTSPLAPTTTLHTKKIKIKETKKCPAGKFRGVNESGLIPGQLFNKIVNVSRVVG